MSEIIRDGFEEWFSDSLLGDSIANIKQTSRITWQHQQQKIDQLNKEFEKAKRALDRAGYTLVDGAQEWKPPIGKSASPFLDIIDSLRKERDELSAPLAQVVPAIRDAIIFIGKDGDEFYAVRDDFTDLQESVSGFGSNPVDALCCLLKTPQRFGQPSPEALVHDLGSE